MFTPRSGRGRFRQEALHSNCGASGPSDCPVHVRKLTRHFYRWKVILIKEPLKISLGWEESISILGVNIPCPPALPPHTHIYIYIYITLRDV